MKILLWAPYGAGTHFWGPGTSAYRLYENYRGNEIEVTLVHASESQGDFPSVFVEQIKLPSLEGTGILGKIKYFREASRWIAKEGHRFDVFHGLSAFEYTFRPALAFSSLNIPTYIKITGQYGGFGKSSFLSEISGIARSRRKNANKIDGYIATSFDIIQNLKNTGIDEKRIFHIPNGVNTGVFFPLDKNFKLEARKKLKIENKFTFIFVGGLTQNKRVFECVQAMNILQKEGLDIQFLIVGPDRSNGLVLEKIRKYLNEQEIQDKVHLMGKTDNPEKYLQVADVFILPSKEEGMPNALLEAMACGLPSIVTPVSGSRDLIVNEKEGLYTTGDPTDIADKAKKMFTSGKYDELSHNARDIIEGIYSSEKILEGHLQLFKKHRTNDTGAKK